MTDQAAPRAPELELVDRAIDLGIYGDETGLDALTPVELEALVETVEGAVARARAAVAAAPVPLVTAIAAAMLEAGEVTKSSVNTEQNYKFASAEAILAAVRRPLLARGVILTAQPRAYIEREIVARSGTKGTLYSLGIDFTFRDGTGAELVITDWRGIGQDFGDKAIGKAYTNAIKTFVRTTWLLPTEHDDPESSSSGESVAATAVELPSWALEASTDRKRMLVDALAVLLGRDNARALCQGVAGSHVGYVPDVLVAFARSIATNSLEAKDSDVAKWRLEAIEARAAVQTRAAQDAAAERPDPPAPEPVSDVTPPDDLPPADGIKAAAQASLDAVQAAQGPPPAEGPPSIEETIRTASDEDLAQWGEHHANRHVAAAALAELEQRLAESVLADEPPAIPSPTSPAMPEDNGPEPGSVDVGDLPGNPAIAIGVLKAAGCICKDPLKLKGAAGDINDQCPIKGHGIPF